MAFFRRRFPRRFIRRRLIRKRTSRFSRRRRTRSRVVSIRRYAQITTSNLITLPAAGLIQNFNTSLNDLAQSSDFSNLFQLYRINKVVTRLQPQGNVNDINLTTSETLPLIYTSVNYDLSNPAALTDVLQRGNVKAWRPWQPITIVWTPKKGIGDAAQDQIFKSKQWVSTTSPGSGHTGFNLASTSYTPTTGTLVQYKIDSWYYVSFKGVK